MRSVKLTMLLLWGLMAVLIFSSAGWAIAPPISLWPIEGGEASEQPVFKWTRVDNATHYNLRVMDAQANVLAYIWYVPQDVGCVVAGTTCSVSAEITLTPGEYTWSMRSWSNTAGYSAFSTQQRFTVAYRHDRYTAAILQARGDAIVLSTTTDAQRRILDWMQQYLDVPNIQVTHQNLPHLLIVALKRMYLKASQHVNDVYPYASSYDFFSLVMASPSTPMWANCGDSAVFVIKALSEFGIAARQVSLWASLNDGHEVLEYYSGVFRRFVYLDALYSVVALDDSGVPASVEDIVEQGRKYGYGDGNWTKWRFKPVSFSGVSTVEKVTAVDPRYESYNSLPYAWGIFRSYVAVIARRFDDLTYLGLTLPGEQVVRGHWLVFDASDLSPYADYFRTAFWPEFLSRFDARQGGRYDLTVVVVSP